MTVYEDHFPINWDDIINFSNEFVAESDRGCVVLGAAFLDDTLRQIISSFLIDDGKETEKLLGVERPLGAFGARIKLAYCLGLITTDEYFDLSIIQRIRNKFAHRLHGLSFADQSVSNQCDLLRIPELVTKSLDRAGNQAPTYNSREKFVLSVSVLSTRLGFRITHLPRERCVVHPEWKILYSLD